MTLLYAGTFLILTAYIYFMIKFIRSWKNTPDFSFSGETGSLKITVIVPFFNEEENLPALLNSLSKQTLESDHWECLFINDSSTDNSYHIVEEFCKRNANCRLTDNNGKGKKSALRTGLEIAKGDLIVTTDADCTFPGNRLKTILNFQNETDSDMIIMPVLMTGHDTFVQRFSNADFLALQMVTAGSVLSGNPLMCNGANLAFKNIPDNISLNEKYISGEDMFLLEWMKRNKKKISWLRSKDVIVRTSSPKNLRQLIFQRSRWISKSGGYRDPALVFFSLLVFAVNLIMPVILFTTLVNPEFWTIFGIWFTAKTVVDYSLIRSGFRFFNTYISFSEFVLMQLLYPFYMIMVSVSGLLFPVRWKRDN